jgi:hypothetical protein
MRRIAMSLAVIVSSALTACSGGGTVFDTGGSNNTPDRVLVTVVSPTNIARVLPGASLAISAQGVKGSQNGYLTGSDIAWTAAVATSGQYPVNSGGVTKPCVAPTITFPGASAVAYAPDLTNFITVDPTNNANIIFTPPTTLPLPSGAPAGTTVAPPTGSNPYCVAVTATSKLNAGAQGTLIVAVVNPAGLGN